MKKLAMFVYFFWYMDSTFQKIWVGPFQMMYDCEMSRQQMAPSVNLIAPYCEEK